MPDFESFVERSSDLFTIVDTEGSILYQNATIEQCGYGREDLVGEQLLEYVHPDDRSRLEPLRRAPAQLSIDDPITYRLRHADGSWRWFETATEPWQDAETGGHVLVSQRLDEQRLDEQRTLERRCEQYATILDSLDDAVYAIDSDDTIVYVNDAYGTLKGIDRDELVGTDIYRWGTDEAIEKIDEARSALEAGDRDVGIAEFEFSTTDETGIPVELRFSVVPDPESDLEQVGVVRDITARKARERALHRKNERLEAFASIVSHDLRNPLNVAAGHLDLARETTDAAADHLEEVALAHDRMETLIEELLVLAREGDAVTELDAVDLAAAVERSWRGVDTDDASLVVDTDRTILADRFRLQQLLENLVRNAVEHGATSPRSNASEDGLEHAEPPVTVTVDSLADGFVVEDDGSGVPDADRERVFEPDYSTSSDGTGFGLGIVAEIVAAHGWDVTLTEGTDGGARFEITGVDVVD